MQISLLPTPVGQNAGMYFFCFFFGQRKVNVAMVQSIVLGLFFFVLYRFFCWREEKIGRTKKEKKEKKEMMMREEGQTPRKSLRILAKFLLFGLLES